METRSTAVLLCVAAIVTAVLMSGSAVADVPQKTNYQVMLTDDSNQPLADQAVTLTFEIYASYTGGSALWTEVHNTTTNSIGVVSAVLGSSTSLSIVDFSIPLWLEIDVDGEVMSPRRELVATPYALCTVDIEDVGDFAGTGIVEDGTNRLALTTVYQTGSAYDGRFVNEGDLPVVVSSVDGVTNDGGDIDLVAGSNITITPNDGANTITIATSGGDDGDWTISGSDIYRLSGNVGIGTSTPDELFHVDGTAQFGSSSQDGRLELYRAGSASPIVEIEEYGVYGGGIEIYDDASHLQVQLRADSAVGGGGELLIRRNETVNGIALNGNYGGSEEPLLAIVGSSRSVWFRMQQTGTDAVELPSSAISDLEIEDEPGGASEGGMPSSGTLLTGVVDVLLSQTITCPTAGYVFAICSAQATTDHPDVGTSSVAYGVSDNNSTLPSTQDLDWAIPETAGAGVYRIPVTSHGLFPVSSGSHTFYFLGNQNAGGSMYVHDVHLSLIFIPTAYGSVYDPVMASGPRSEEVAGSRPPLTASEIAAQRAESEAFNAARIEQELADMRAQMDELTRRMDDEGR